MKNESVTKKEGSSCYKEGQLILKEVKKTELLTLEYRMYEEGSCRAPYSIEVVATNGINEINAVLENCFDLFGEARSFFELISRNLVTPVSLSYIYEDYCE